MKTISDNIPEIQNFVRQELNSGRSKQDIYDSLKHEYFDKSTLAALINDIPTEAQLQALKPWRKIAIAGILVGLIIFVISIFLIAQRHGITQKKQIALWLFFAMVVAWQIFNIKRILKGSRSHFGGIFLAFLLFPIVSRDNSSDTAVNLFYLAYLLFILSDIIYFFKVKPPHLKKISHDEFEFA